MDDYIHLVIPPVVKLFDPIDFPYAVSITALETINQLAEILDFSDFSSRIIHPLVRVLDNHPDLRGPAMQTLCSLVIQLEKKYLVFVPLVTAVLTKHRIISTEYEKLLPKLQSNTTLPLDDEFRLRQAKFKNREIINPTESNTMKKLNVSGTELQLAWKATRRVSKEDWMEWLRRLSTGLLKESQSPALRSCRNLAQNYYQLQRDLFNAAFVSCWTELSPLYKKELAANLQQALMEPDISEITQTILNLAEFMEHCDRDPLPISPQILGDRAMMSRA